MDQVDVIGVSTNSAVLRAIEKAAQGNRQIVRSLQLGADLAALPALLDQIAAEEGLLVFVEHPAVPDPELLEAAAQILEKDPWGNVFLLVDKEPPKLPREVFFAGVCGLLTPPFDQGVSQTIRRSVERYG